MSTENSDMYRTYRDRLDDSGQRVLEHALERSHSLGQHYISVPHILDALGSNEAEPLDAALKALGIDPSSFKLSAEGRIKAGPRYGGPGTRLDPEVIDIFRRALGIAQARTRTLIGAADLLVALTQNEQGTFMLMLNEFGISPGEAAERLRPLLCWREAGDASPGEEGRSGFMMGDMVRIRSGAYAGFTGRVLRVHPDKPTLDVAVTFRGRSQRLQCNFSEVERLIFQQDTSE